MYKIEDNSDKICSLYVNEMHLVVMLMPYIEENLEKNEKIVTMFEKDLNGELNTLLDRTNFDNKKKDRIKKINWSEKRLDDIEKIKDGLENKIVIINGSREYEERVNNTIKGTNTKIINCIKLDDFENRAGEILSKHNKILNTLGEQKISDVFHVDLRVDDNKISASEHCSPLQG